MRSVGHRAQPFASAEAYLASPHRLLFDCVVADVAMPGIDGLGLVRKLREQDSTIPVILITALPDRRLEGRADSVGAQCLLRKPFEAEALIECIDKSLSK